MQRALLLDVMIAFTQAPCSNTYLSHLGSHLGWLDAVVGVQISEEEDTMRKERRKTYVFGG